MAVYQYQGMDKSGKEIKGTVNAENPNLARQKIRAQGIMLMALKETGSDERQKNPHFTFGGSINVNELALMTRQLATLLKARIPLVQALDALIDQTGHPKMRVILSEVKQKVNEGASLAKTLAEYPKVFTNVYVNMVEAGESSGTLHVVLLKLADFTEAQVKLKNKIRSAMVYPLIMAVFGTGMMAIIFTVVIPKITKIFISMKKPLPWTTKLSIEISYLLTNYWWAIIAGAVALYYLFNQFINSPGGKALWHRFLLQMPIVGGLVKMINIGRFCSTLSTLLNSGVPILASMNIVRNLISNVHIQQAVQEARSSVAEGASLAGPLAKSGHFPPMVTHMISLGEKSGELESMLSIIAENYEDQVENKLSGLTSVLEPIMMIILGLAVAFIVFSVVMPMMELNKVR